MGLCSGSRCIEFIIRPIFLRRTHVILRRVQLRKNFLKVIVPTLVHKIVIGCGPNRFVKFKFRFVIVPTLEIRQIQLL
ncbi:hypothetical protein LEP1GSC170_0852 [Leptospira interrogans serovar Bataviae str. HAI135]|nr:hypothetical protein LEP1GSC170_0852 [Leptospira interrogans serovar Bataviae str. HAI135]